MLVLAVHSFEQVTAKVPFSIILLQDLVSSKKCPPELKCRQVVPTSGSKSTSLWDVTDPEELLQWLNANCNVDCTHEIFEVQEEFSIGVMGEVGRARAAERVSSTAKELGEKTAAGLTRTATAVSHQAQEIDHKLKISERAAAAAEAVKESAVARGTVAFLGKAGSAVKSATHKVVDSERVQSTTHVIGSSFKRLGSGLRQSLSNKGRVNSSQEDAAPLEEEQAPQYARPPAADYEAPHQESATLRNPSAAPPAPAAAAPASSGGAAAAPASPPARVPTDPTPASPPPETLAFTLDDSEAAGGHSKQA